MYLPFIFFFLSLAGIIVMIGRELVLVKNGQVSAVQHSHSHPFVEDLQKIKHLTYKNTKKLGYAMIFVTFRFFIKSSNFIKTKSVIFIKELKNKLKKNNSLNEEQKNEVSRYLKVISEYKQKIKRIKHIIKEEEGIE